jgi:hypothetical protein
MKFTRLPSASSDLNGWIKWKDQTPTDAQWPIFATTYGKAEVYFLYSKTGSEFPQGIDCNNALWRPVAVPTPPKAKSLGELENDAILEAWRRRGIDYMNDTLEDLSQDFLYGWARGKIWARAEEAKAAK